MEKMELTAIEAQILERSANLDITRRRRIMVLISAGLYGFVLIAFASLTQSWQYVLAVSLAYIAITCFEKVAYANGVLVYKSVIQKLCIRIEELVASEDSLGSQ